MPWLKPETVADIKREIAELGKPYVSGSSGKEGWSYLPIPFYEFRTVPFHRPDSYDRFDAMLKRVPFKNRHIVDLGCSTGFFSFAMMDAGAREVIGIEYDEKAFNICQKLKEVYEYSDALQFAYGLVEDNLVYINDIVLAMSIAQWVRIRSGDDAMSNFLVELSKRSKVAFIEIPLLGSGGAGIPWLENEIEIGYYLSNEIGFKHVELLIDVSSHAGKRGTWMCSMEEVP